MKDGSAEKKSTNDIQINRGFELMLRSAAKSQQKIERPWFQIKFGKIISFFKKEIHFFFEVRMDIKKKV